MAFDSVIVQSPSTAAGTYLSQLQLGLELVKGTHCSMRVDLQISFTFVFCCEVVDVVEMVLCTYQIQPSQCFMAIDRARISVDFQHLEDKLKSQKSLR